MRQASEWLPMKEPLLEVHNQRSVIMGPQTHRLPAHVMWGITLLTAMGMAVINFVTILAIKASVTFKFGVMQAMISRAGVGFGILVLALFSMAYATAGVCLIQFVAPSCGGSGLPENKCYLNGSRSLPGFFTRRTLRVRVATTILANAAGFPVGREGPTVVIGSNLAFLISEAIAEPWVKEWVDFSRCGHQRPALIVDKERLAHATRIQCAVGGACGMAMIFNAPFGGLLYMFEEITSIAWPWELTFRVFVATMCCALISYGLLDLYNADIKDFVIYAFVPEDKTWTWTDVPLFLAVSASLGVITSYHTRGMLYMAGVRQRMATSLKRWQPHAKIFETILYCALCAVLSCTVSLLGTCTEEGESNLQYVRFNCDEGEYNPIASLLVNTSHSSVKLLFSGNNAGEIHWSSALSAFVTYYLLNVGLAGLPVPGGAFTATMLLGGLFGRAVGGLGRELGIVNSVSGVYAVVGSAAMLCGFKQMTLAVVLIVVECVNDLTLAPVVMLGVSVSMMVNWGINERGHDDEQIERKDLPFLEAEAPHSLDNLAAHDLCDPLPPSAILSADAPVHRVKRALEDGKLICDFPIVDESGSCIGIITRPHLESALQVSCGLGGHKRTRSRAFTENPFEVHDDSHVKWLNGRSIFVGDSMLAIHRIMDPTPFTIVEDMPAPRFYALFAKAGEKAACVTNRKGEFRGIISRAGLIRAARHGVGQHL